MGKVRAELHHWWPRCVSSFWKNADGKVSWLLPNGEVKSAPPSAFGAIRDGHSIKFHVGSKEGSIWDCSFEAAFSAADNAFPQTIAWAEKLKPTLQIEKKLGDRFSAQEVSDSQLRMLVEGIVSLAVRSPMNREACVSTAEHLRGTLPERERNRIIAANMQHAQVTLVRKIGLRGKFVLIYSEQKEFIFGDGFYHSGVSMPDTSSMPCILVPLTPRVSCLYYSPLRYSTEPMLSLLSITGEEASTLNDVVQIYSRNALFYRNERPDIIDAFRQGKHLCYADFRNSISMLCDSIPGVVPL
jgi:hypothetical protein